MRVQVLQKGVHVFPSCCESSQSLPTVPALISWAGLWSLCTWRLIRVLYESVYMEINQSIIRALS